MQHSYTIARNAHILDLLTREGGMSNVEIAETMGLKYHVVKRLTQQLEAEGRITGRFNSFGGHFSNVSWFVVPSKAKMPTETSSMTSQLYGPQGKIGVSEVSLGKPRTIQAFVKVRGTDKYISNPRLNQKSE
ncbi:MAG TPA: winged helix-turn-helix domain-containing protein [Verrucomicrobiae bacterium]|nr:winged helix-turn-helix domain-containing protein [Verrucomicrobiae bacterium]